MNQGMYQASKKSLTSPMPFWNDNHGNVHFGATLKEAKAKAAEANRDN